MRTLRVVSASLAALLAAAPALAQDKKAVTPAEMNYQAGASPLAATPRRRR
jgi:nitrite reductase (NO-forming)/hydroxylamine reductase